MSTYEKIASVLIGILVATLIIFSYREIKEPEQPTGSHTSSSFNESLGQNFIIGPFATVASEQSSGGAEANCQQLQPVIIGALHDIKEHLETHNILNLFTGADEKFEVNQQTLQLFCNKQAEVTLTDTSGNKLVLQKMPFARVVIPQGTTTDSGTEVRINATVAPKGAAAPTQPTTQGDILIPDRYLDATTSSAQ